MQKPKNLLLELIKKVLIAVIIFIVLGILFHWFENKSFLHADIDSEIYENYEYNYNDASFWNDKILNQNKSYPELNQVYVEEEQINTFYIIGLTHEISHCCNQCYNERENEFLTFKYLWEKGQYRGEALFIALTQIFFGWLNPEYFCGDLILDYLF